MSEHETNTPPETSTIKNPEEDTRTIQEILRGSRRIGNVAERATIILKGNNVLTDEEAADQATRRSIDVH